MVASHKFDNPTNQLHDESFPTVSNPIFDLGRLCFSCVLAPIIVPSDCWFTCFKVANPLRSSLVIAIYCISREWSPRILVSAENAPIYGI